MSSLLGLDKLAAEKRKEAQEKELTKFKEKSRPQAHDNADNKHRTYRRPAEETPSYIGEFFLKVKISQDANHI